MIQTGVCSSESCSLTYLPYLLSVDSGYRLCFENDPHSSDGGIESGVPEVWLFVVLKYWTITL